MHSGASGRAVTTTPPDRVSIRPAERADLLAVLGIERAAFPQPWPYQAFEGFLGEPGFLVAVDELGRGDGDERTPGLGARSGDGVVWRGRGVGSRLLSRGLSVLAAGGARRAKLEVRASNEAAQALYRSFGFEPDNVISRYYDDGEDALLFVADLDGRPGGGR